MTESTDRNVVGQVMAWAAGQPFNNLLLIAILVAIGWLGYYGLTSAIPQHLNAIQSGYEKIEQAHRDEREQTIKTYDRWFDLKPRTVSTK